VHKVTRAAKALGTIGCGALLVAVTAPAVASADPIPQPAPVAALPMTAAPLPPAAAANEAAAEYQESTETAVVAMPIVTVESTPTGPKIVSHPVSSSAQARAVATDAAQGNDLISVQSDSIVRATGAPTNDQFAPNLWGLDRAKTTFTNAWSVTTGKGVIVAVIDTGVDARHPDLAGQVLPGRAFLNNGPAGVAMNPGTDNCGHGTHVAGTIAALANNRIGTAGAAPGVKILPIKVLNCSGLNSDVANGVKWAANNGARVINLSLGGTVRDTALEAAINYARTKKVVVVAAAGNNWYHKTCNPKGNNATSYPGASPGVIGVGAVDSNLNRSCFSNVGPAVDLVAPGGAIASTYPVNLTAKNYVPYSTMSGTSMATPHVSAAAAMVLSRRMTCTSDQVEKRLETMARRLGGTTSRNDTYGYGLVDPAKAVAAFAC
jgi:subtilisin family serine protease